MSNVNQNLTKLLSGEDIKSPFLKIDKGTIIVKNLNSIKGLQFSYQGRAEFSTPSESIVYARLSENLTSSKKLISDDGIETSWFVSASNDTGVFMMANLLGESLTSTIDGEIEVINFISNEKFRITSAVIVESKDKAYRIGVENIIIVDNKYYKQSSNFDSISFEWNEVEEDKKVETILTTNFEPTIKIQDLDNKNTKIGDIENVSSYTTKL